MQSWTGTLDQGGVEAGSAVHDHQVAPVLLVHAEWDVDVPLDAAQAYFLALRNARYRRWVEIGEGTHMVLLERQRMQAFRAVSDFLTEREPVSI